MNWIPVELAVPKKPYRVLVRIFFGEGDEITDIAEYFGDGEWIASKNVPVTVTKWMPLPE
jgi:hypothetical protein